MVPSLRNGTGARMIQRHVVALVLGAALAAPSWAQQPAARPGPTPAPPSPSTPSVAPPVPSATPAAPSAAPAASAPTNVTKPAYVVSGFRSATFGMTEAEVRAAIQKDFSVKLEDIRSTPNALER